MLTLILSLVLAATPPCECGGRDIRTFILAGQSNATGLYSGSDATWALSCAFSREVVTQGEPLQVGYYVEAKSGTYLSEHLPGAVDGWYEAAIAAAHTASHLGGLLWIHGEWDSKNTGQSGYLTYESDLEGYFAAWHTEFPGLPIVVAGLHTLATNGYPHQAVIRQALIDACAAETSQPCVVVDTSAYGSGTLHWDHDQADAVGHLLGAAYSTLIAN